MANSPDQNSIVDMFTRFGKDLKLPTVDVQTIIDHHRRNLEALQKSAETAGSGATRIMERQREMLQDTLREITDMAQSYRSPTNPQDMMARQTEFARKSFETAVKNATEMTDLVRQSSTETIEVLRQRIKDGMEEIRTGNGSRK